MRGTRRATVVLASAVALLATVLLAGCGSRVPSDPPAISGTIAAVTRNDSGNAGSILIEGSGSIGDKASLEIGGTTPVLRVAKDGSVSSATFAELKIGMRVNAWIDGPVRESYPVQGTASVVAIVE
jgi:hypothetical protein